MCVFVQCLCYLIITTHTQVTLPPGRRVEGRYWHSATATCLVPGLSEVLMFGGCREWQNYVKSFNDLRAITDTIILQFGETYKSLKHNWEFTSPPPPPQS